MASWLLIVLPSLPYLQVSGEYLTHSYLVDVAAYLGDDAYLVVLNASGSLEVRDKKSANQ